MRNRYLKRSILLIIMLFLCQFINAQTDTAYKQKSIQIHGSAMMYLFAGMNLEFYTWVRSKSITGLSAGLGYWDNGFEIPVHFYTLWNKESVHHPELDYGLNFLIITGDRLLPLPTLSIGYRYQNLTKKSLVLRVGLNLGVIPYISIGYAF